MTNNVVQQNQVSLWFYNTSDLHDISLENSEKYGWHHHLIESLHEWESLCMSLDENAKNIKYILQKIQNERLLNS